MRINVITNGILIYSFSFKEGISVTGVPFPFFKICETCK